MSKFNISKIEIENFRSIQTKVVLEIKPGLFSIEGINMDEPSSTNGAGKSTLISALYWCLTGNTLTNEVLADEVINAKVGKNCKVVVHIDSDQGIIKVTRTRKDSELGNNLLLEIDGQDLSCHKIADTQSRINQLLKIPFELLHSTIMMTYDIRSAFSELSPQQRVQVLESIRDYSIWDKVREEANKDIKLYNKEIQENKLKVSNLTGSLSTYKSMLEKEKSISVSLVNNFDLNKLNATNSQFLTDKNTLNQEIEKLQEEVKVLENKQFPDTSSLQKELAEIIDSANSLKLANQKINFEIDNANKEILVIEKWFRDDKCPTCGKPLDRDSASIQSKNIEKEKLNTLIITKQKEIETNEIAIKNKRQEWSNKNSTFQNLDKDKVENLNAIKAVNQNIINKKAELSKIEKNIFEIETSLKNHENELIKNNKTITEYIDKISTLEKEIEETDKIIKDFEFKRQLSDYFYKLLGSKGELRPYLLNKDIECLNLFMQRYISKFFDNTEVTLKLNGASIEILIDSKGIKKSVSSLSGGEKKRLNLAIQFALYDLLKMTAQISFNILWLDEIEAQLDTLGIQQLINIIDDKSEEIESVMWITNSNDVKEHIPNKIICKKIMGKTEVEQ